MKKNYEDYNEYEEDEFEKNEYDEPEYEELEYDEEDEIDDDGIIYDEDEILYEEDLEEEDDDTLNHILNEIVRLKKKIRKEKPLPAPSSAQPSMVMPMPSHGNNSSEIALYNEISKLRDDMNKTQSTQAMQNEMKRLQEEIEKTKKQNNDVMLMEMKRLKRKIDALNVSNAAKADKVLVAEPSVAVAPINFSALEQKVSAATQHIQEIVVKTSDEKSKLLSDKLDEIKMLIEEIEVTETNVVNYSDDAANYEKNDSLNQQLSALNEQIEDLKENLTSLPLSDDINDKLDEIALDISAQLISIKDEYIPNFITLEEQRLKELQENLALTKDDEERRAMLLEVSELRERLKQEQTGILSKIDDHLQDIKDKLATAEDYDVVTEILSLKDDIKASRILNNNDLTAELESLKADVGDIKSALTDLNARKTAVTETVKQISDSTDGPTSEEVNMLLGEIVSLRDEIQTYKDDVNHLISEGATKQDSVVSSSPSMVADEGVTDILDELAGLRSIIRGAQDDQAAKLLEIEDLKDLITDLKQTVLRSSIAETAIVAPSVQDDSLISEILALKEDIRAMKTESDNNLYGEIMDSLDSVKYDVKAIRNEPDLTAMNEVLALREEFQAFKDEMEKTRSGFEIAERFDLLSKDLQSLREQIFTIAMANVTQEGSETEQYESFNNIILDELGEIKEAVLSTDKDELKERLESLNLEILNLKDLLEQ